MKRYVMLLPVVLIVIAGLKLTASDEQAAPKREKVQDKALMELKLSAMKMTLEGLVNKDFGSIRKAGNDLLKLEDSKMWIDVKDDVYAHYRGELSAQANKLVRLAEAKNLDGVAFTYVNLVGTCMDCHTHCRDVLKIAALKVH